MFEKKQREQPWRIWFEPWEKWRCVSSQGRNRSVETWARALAPACGRELAWARLLSLRLVYSRARALALAPERELACGWVSPHKAASPARARVACKLAPATRACTQCQRSDNNGCRRRSSSSSKRRWRLPLRAVFIWALADPVTWGCPNF